MSKRGRSWGRDDWGWKEDSHGWADYNFSYGSRSSSVARPSKRARWEDPKDEEEEEDEGPPPGDFGYEEEEGRDPGEYLEPGDDAEPGFEDEFADEGEAAEEGDGAEQPDGGGEEEAAGLVPAVMPEQPPAKPKPSLALALRRTGERDLLAEIQQVGPRDPKLAITVDVYEVPKKLIAKVIGRKGSQVRAIRDETGAHIDARDQTDDPVPVKLMGTAKAIENAKARIQEIIDSANAPKEGLVLDVPMVKIGKVIGIKGKQINEIQVMTGAKVDVDKEQDPCKVTIGGTDAQIAEAQRMILTLTMEVEDVGSEYIDLPGVVAGAVLGKGGTRLCEIQESSGARIDVDKTWPGILRVRIAGDPEQIAVAKHLVQQAASLPRGPPMLMNGTVNQVLQIPAGMGGMVIMQGAERIQQIQAEYGAGIWVDVKNSQAHISGPPQTVQTVMALMGAVVEETTAGGGMPMLEETSNAEKKQKFSDQQLFLDASSIQLHPKVLPTSPMQLAFALLAAKKWQDGAEWD